MEDDVTYGHAWRIDSKGSAMKYNEGLANILVEHHRRCCVAIGRTWLMIPMTSILSMWRLEMLSASLPVDVTGMA